MNQLVTEKCEVLGSNAQRLTEQQLKSLLAALQDWTLTDDKGLKKIQKNYSFKDFATALAFTQRIAALAEEEDHHPTIVTEWGSVTVIWWTHSVRGLHRNDFIMAARCDQLYN